jgi:hypothetical protein
MTDPSDETEPHANVYPAPVTAAPRADGAAARSGDDASRPLAQPASAEHATAPPSSGGPSAPVLQADPNRPADSGWREPAWIPPRKRDARPSLAALIVGFVLIAIGAWFFLDRTLGVELPRLQWSTIWPVILIVVGGLIIIRSIQRKA